MYACTVCMYEHDECMNMHPLSLSRGVCVCVVGDIRVPVSSAGEALALFYKAEKHRAAKLTTKYSPADGSDFSYAASRWVGGGTFKYVCVCIYYMYVCM